ncbi:hypothetical protein F441_14491 [Phytophthora nicotianae CJ01A1]|uniref:RNA-binding protein 48 n=2 Tax=Phytophthora nicotianae TaxID=4792 RepID=W2IGJ2_PHYNI|nr:hypothetical protein L915_14253 [Phytophthora nicotianae]ETL33379.1 hypothetical protein L916_14158 [Phytophthora nicotianae]ETP09702.1 hypothetical protein F441_14491 [Phytophthora nicotianae CJ01A1]
MAGRSVRVFTVANESRYVVVRNVPALGVIEDLLKRLSLYGKVCEYRLLDHADDREAALQFEDASNDDSEFTDTVWVQYETVNNARHAKARGVQKPFYGNKLQMSYAPQFESREDTGDKLAQRRQLLQRRARPNVYRAEKRSTTWTPPLPPPLPPPGGAKDTSAFIGPQLPSRPQQFVPRPLQTSPRPQYPMDRPQQNTKRRRI